MSLLRKMFLKFIQDPDGTKREVTTQYPLPVSDGCVCASDIWVAESDMGGFSGVVTDLFDNLHSVVVDSTATNPKEIIIHFSRTIVANAIGIGSYAGAGGSFSNVSIQIAVSDGVFVTVVDESSDSTAKNTASYQLPVTAGINAVKLRFHTANTITISNVVIPTAKATVARIQAKSSLDSLVEDITSYRGALDVNSAWVHRKIVNETYHQHTATTTTLSSAASEGDTQIVVVSAVGFAIGDNVKLEESSTQELGVMVITNIVGTTITLDRPLANDYTTAADVIKVLINMNVLGTLSSPEIFEIDPPPGTVWQITRILISITDATAMDDSRFGGLAALTNGVTLKAITEAGRTAVFANWKSNSDIKLDMYDVEYSPKAPAGFFGLNGRWTFTKSEVVAELDGNGSPIQKLEVLIQDDLTGLVSFNIRAQGRVFSP